MERRLIEGLAALVAGTGDVRTRPGAAVAAFLSDYGLGEPKGSATIISDADRAAIRAVVLKRVGIDLSLGLPDFDAMTRTQAASGFQNEKIARKGPRSARVAVRPVGTAAPSLPSPRSCLDMDADEAATWARTFAQAAMMVENWEVFERLHDVDFDLGVDVPSVAFYRGDQGAYPLDAARTFAISLGVPVHVFADLDPAGIVIAKTFPGFAEMVLPPEDRIAALAEGGYNRDRFHAQSSSHASAAGDADRPHGRLWSILLRTQSAIPQEVFVSDRSGAETVA